MMDGARYRQVLEDRLDFLINRHGTTHFLQEVAPCHGSKVVKNWFAGKPNIELIKWPGNSPDLNPIEKVWAWMKKLWGSSGWRTPPTSREPGGVHAPETPGGGRMG
jgi:transposase